MSGDQVLERLLEQPAALAAGGVIGAALITLVAPVLNLFVSRKRRIDKLREALRTDVELLGKLPKGSDAYRIIRETADHTARKIGYEQRQRTNQYYTTLIVCIPVLFFSATVTTGLTAANAEHGFPIAIIGYLMVAGLGYGFGRLQGWIVRFINQERAAMGDRPWFGAPLTTGQVERLGRWLRRRRGHADDSLSSRDAEKP